MQLTRRAAIKKGSFAAASAYASSLLISRSLAESSARSATSAPNTFAIRELYAPAHFGNAYEAMWPGEMKAYLTEMKWWGFNRFSDWITTTDVRNPYVSDATWDLAREQLERKKKAFRAAQDLGLGLNLIVTPNHVYLDQLRPEIGATKTSKIFGQLLCPSQPEGRKIILANVESWFRDLAESGLQFSAWTGFAYDYGGCDCSKCRPWIVTFAQLSREIHAVAQKYHPKIEPWFCSWWWTPEEHEALNKWAEKEAPQWLKAITLHLEYEKTRFKDVAVPAGCRKIAFVHNGYADTLKQNDIYAKWGATIAPKRIPTTLHDIGTQEADGYQAYSEGIFDDVNKALLAGISSGQFADPNSVLKAYATRYFGATEDKARWWADWLAAWGFRKQVNLPAALKEFETLCAGIPQTWRLEHWGCKLRLEQLDRLIGTPKPNEWTDEKLKTVDQFWSEQEHLYRDVYRLGPVRHVFAQKFVPPVWYDSWQKATKAAPKKGSLPSEA